MAEVGCPHCGRIVAKVLQAPGGALSVEYRSLGMAERPEPVYGVEDRRWYRWEVPEVPDDGSSWAGTEAACRDVHGCGGRFILEARRVRQLAERAGALGHSVRWTPDEADIERSDGLGIYSAGHSPIRTPATRQAAMQGAWRLRMSEPPPLPTWLRRVRA